MYNISKIMVSNTHSNKPTYSSQVQSVMTEVVSDATRYAYCNTNTKFVLWLTEDKERRKTLCHWFLNNIKKVKEDSEIDCIEKNVRLMIKESIENIHSENNFPIKLKKLNFNIISEFIVSQKKSTDTEETTYYGKTTYNKMMSAFKNIYRCCGTKVPSGISSNLYVLLGGMKRRVASEKSKKELIL